MGETMTNAISEYVAKCLAECPEGAEEVLLAELARRLLARQVKDDPVLVRDAAGPVGYLFPLEEMGPPVLVDENSPEFAAEVRRRLEDDGPPIAEEAFAAYLKTLMEEDLGPG
jgi:hypothetical protein